MAHRKPYNRTVVARTTNESFILKLTYHKLIKLKHINNSCTVAWMNNILKQSMKYRICYQTNISEMRYQNQNDST